MSRWLLFILLVLTTAGPAIAQEADTRPVRDSAFAVHNLFRKHRRIAMGDAGLGLAALTQMGLQAAAGQGSNNVLFVAFAVIPSVLGFRKLARYNEGREGLIVRQYEQGWPLPPHIRRRLKPKHFKAQQ